MPMSPTPVGDTLRVRPEAIRCINTSQNQNLNRAAGWHLCIFRTRLEAFLFVVAIQTPRLELIQSQRNEQQGRDEGRADYPRGTPAQTSVG